MQVELTPAEGLPLATPTGASGLPSLAPGSTFGRYEVVRCIGAGGMGAVYEATHSLLRKRVALKTLHPQLTTQFDFRARFLREGETLARIQHPNVVDISDVGVCDGLTYLVMEFLEGESLHELLTREVFLDERRLANLMLPLVDGLGAAHAAGVVHRDLKPENIMLARDAKGEIRPKLLDFGISKVEGTPQSMALTSGGAMLGTPFYMSPEQARGGANVDWRSDQYALGVVLYECATGKLPFQHATLFDQMNAVAMGVYEHPCAVRPELSAELAEVMIRAMSLDPAHRFDSLEALGRALLPFAGSRARAYYEAVFAEEGPTPESVRPAMPTFDTNSGAVAVPPAALTPPRAPRLVIPIGTPTLAAPRRQSKSGAQELATAPRVLATTLAEPAATDPLPAPLPAPDDSPRRRRGVALAAGLVLLLGLGAALAAYGWSARPTASASRAATPRTPTTTIPPAASPPPLVVTASPPVPPLPPAPSIPVATDVPVVAGPAAILSPTAAGASPNTRRHPRVGAAPVRGTDPTRPPPTGDSLDIRLTR